MCGRTFPSVGAAALGAVVLTLALNACRGDEARIRAAERLYEQSRFRDAERKLAPLFQADVPQTDSARLLFGNVLLARGSVHRARAHFRILLGGSGSYRCAALYGLARSHFYLGHPDTARVRSRQLLQCARRRADTLYVARAHHVWGRVNFYEADYDRAFVRQRTSLRWARRAGHANARADALRQLGVLHWYRGRSDTAMTAFYEPALRLYRATGDSAGVATTLSNMGLIHRKYGGVRKNARLQVRAFALRKRMGDQIGLADSYSFLASIPGHFGHDNPAYRITYLRKSLDLSRRIGYAWGEQVAFDQLRGNIREDLGYWNLYREPASDSSFQRSGESRFLQKYYAGMAARHQEQWSRANRLLARTYQLADSLGYQDAERTLLIVRSRVLMQLGRWDAAQAVIQKAPSETRDDQPLVFRTSAAQIRARIALHQGDPDRAVDVLRPVASEYDRLYLDALHEAASEVAFETAAGTLHGRRARVYGGLVRALIRQENPRAFRYMERERALPFWGGSLHGNDGREAFGRFVRQLEKLEASPGETAEVERVLTTLGELYREQVTQQHILDRTGASAEDLHVTSPDALRQVLQEDEVFVEYFVTKRQLCAFVARRDSSRFMPLPLEEEELATAVKVYRMALRRGHDHPEERVWMTSGQRLFEAVMAPLLRAGWVRGGDHLLIAPHRRLYSLPFHALPVSAPTSAPHFLIERNVVSYVPSATRLVEQRNEAPRPVRSMLAVAPDTDRLPHTGEEVETLRRIRFPQTRILQNADARVSRVQREWSAYDLVHLAAHARTNSRFPLYSHVQLHEGRMELYEVLQHNLQARLVVLSACETGRAVGSTGEAPTGASLVSFPRAFLSAGVEGVVGSLWRVNDAATATLMRHFYRAWAVSGKPALPATLASPGSNEASSSLAQALTHAQRTYLEQARHSDTFVHPFYWAGFYLIGDGR